MQLVLNYSYFDSFRIYSSTPTGILANIRNFKLISSTKLSKKNFRFYRKNEWSLSLTGSRRHILALASISLMVPIYISSSYNCILRIQDWVCHRWQPDWERRVPMILRFENSTLSLTIPWTYSHFASAPDWLPQLVGVIFKFPIKRFFFFLQLSWRHWPGKHKERFLFSPNTVHFLDSSNQRLYKLREYHFILKYLFLTL